MKIPTPGKLSRVLRAGAVALGTAAKESGATVGSGIVGIVTADGLQRFEAISLDETAENAILTKSVVGDNLAAAMQAAARMLSVQQETASGAYDIIMSEVVGKTEFVAAWRGNGKSSSENDKATSSKAVEAMIKVFTYHCILS